MIEQLIALDKYILLAINAFNHPIADTFMYTYSGRLEWLPLYLSLIYVMVRNYGKQSIWIILGIILTVVVADQIASGLLKNMVQRLRPSHNPDFEGIVHLVNNYRSGRYGFVSSHAANSLGIAMISLLFVRNKHFSIAIMAWAIVTSYSRMYLGVHYPLDIIGGMLVGFFTASVFYMLLRKFGIHSKPNNKHTQIPIIVLLLTIVTILIYAVLSN